MEIIPIVTKDNLQKAQIEQLQKEQKEYKLIGKQRRLPGHTLFSFNTVTGEIKPADINNEAIMNFDGTVTLKSKTIIEPNCFYEQALNKKNFVKRLKRQGFI